MNTNYLDHVRSQLDKMASERKLSEVSDCTGIHRTTLWRIKDEPGYDPSYKQVHILVDYFWPKGKIK